MQDVNPKVTMTADLDVIPGRPFKGEATPVSSKVKSTEDDLNLLVALDEPEMLVKAVFKVATELSSNVKWAIIARAMAAASVELEEANAPAPRP